MLIGQQIALPTDDERINILHHLIVPSLKGMILKWDKHVSVFMGYIVNGCIGMGRGDRPFQWTDIYRAFSAQNHQLTATEAIDLHRVNKDSCQGFSVFQNRQVVILKQIPSRIALVKKAVIMSGLPMIYTTKTIEWRFGLYIVPPCSFVNQCLFSVE